MSGSYPSALAERTVMRITMDLVPRCRGSYVGRLHAMTSRPGAASAAGAPTEVTIEFIDGSSVRYNRFWLRDSCPSNGDRASLFRTFSVASTDHDVTIDRVKSTTPVGRSMTFRLVGERGDGNPTQLLPPPSASGSLTKPEQGIGNHRPLRPDVLTVARHLVSWGNSCTSARSSGSHPGSTWS
jgi:hypothetical protein